MNLVIDDHYVSKWRNNTIQMKNNLIYMKDYLEYIYRLVLNSVSDMEIQRDVVIGDYDIAPTNNPVRIGINYEHTLYEENGELVVKPDLYETRKDSNLILDYSEINIQVLKTSRDYKEYGNKTIYIAPAYYTLRPHVSNRQDIVLTSFIYINHTFPHRLQLIQGLLDQKLPWKNLSGCFHKKEFEDILHSVKIIVNIRQESRRKILEEIRLLPALLCGCLIVCEEALMSELVPYKDCIIWAKFEDIPKKVKEVYDSYELWYDRIFGNPENLRILSRLHTENELRLKSSLKRLLS